MRYLNASEILPDELLKEVQKYADGAAIYIPKCEERTKWGSKSGSRQFYEKRNEEIRAKYAKNHSYETLAEEYCLSLETIRKIIYNK